jgi:hypothetical protein
MPTECNAEQLDFGIVEGRAVEAAFDGGAVTSDAGALLLSAADRAIDLMRRVAACFSDRRRAELIEHEVVTLVGQRVFAIALGYEDLNDHDELRHDPVMAVLAGKLEARRADCAPAAGKSTLNRLELSQPSPSRYHKISYRAAELERLLVDVFVEAHERAPRQIILDLDATDDPLHGHQEGRFFHGYYDCYCYLPLYVFCGRHLLAAKLRPANIDAAAGSVEEVERIVRQLRGRWPRSDPRGQDEFAAVLDLGSKVFDERLKADDLIVGIAVFFVVRIVVDVLHAAHVITATYECLSPHRCTPSAQRRALSTVYLSANNRNGLLIDRSSIPCLEGGEIGFARLISGPCAPAMSLEEIRRRGQRVPCDVETPADAVV